MEREYNRIYSAQRRIMGTIIIVDDWSDTTPYRETFCQGFQWGPDASPIDRETLAGMILLDVFENDAHAWSDDENWNAIVVEFADDVIKKLPDSWSIFTDSVWTWAEVKQRSFKDI